MRCVTAALAYSLAVFGTAGASPAQIQGTPEDKAAIEKILAENVEAINKHDPVAASRRFTPDAEFTNVAGTFVKGATEIEKFLGAGFATRLKAATWKPMTVTIRFIRPDVAIVHATSQISGFLNPDGSTEPPHNELSMRVFQKDNGVWRIAAFHNTRVAAGSPRN